MRHFVLPATRRADEIAWNALVYGASPALEERECPECQGWGFHVLHGEGPLGTNLRVECETCDGRGRIEEDDE